MNLSQFITERQQAWQELERLIARAEDGLHKLTSDHARRLADYYRRASADLVQARTYGANAEVTEYLESLVARGYALLYPVPRLKAFRRLFVFFRETFPRTLRQETFLFGLVVAAFVLGVILGAIATSLDPEGANLFVPAEHQAMSPRQRVESDEKAAAGGGQFGLTGHAAFSTFLFTHNIGVSINCFAMGLAWGLPTLLFIGYHGVFVAALGVEYIRDGVGLFFLAWILPHGVVELTSIFIAGAAGLCLGRGVLRPQGKPRGQRLREEARTALILLGGAAGLLVPAGIIEGTISQIHEPTLPYVLKILFAVVVGLGLYGYLWFLPVPRKNERGDEISAERGTIENATGSIDGRFLVIRTPEQVSFRYPLAGPVERVCALLGDYVIITALCIGVVMSLSGLFGFGIVLMLIAIFLIKWGYFLYFEWRWEGSTPGKKMMGIKVVQMEGVRCSFDRLVLRNFMRAVDWLPILYGLGGLMALLNRRGARLGDLVAGTVCIRMPRPLPPKAVAEIQRRFNSLREDPSARDRIRQILTPDEVQTVTSLAIRREVLEAAARIRLFRQCAEFLRRRLRLAKHDTMTDENLVLNVAAVLMEEKVL